MFEEIGRNIDIFISQIWEFLKFVDTTYAILPEALISVFLVFFIECIRRPRVSVKFINYSSDFNLYKSKKWHICVTYEKNGFLNRFLFKYPLNNLKVTAQFYDVKFTEIHDSFQCKPDINPNVYEERDVPSALAPINLARGEHSNFPILLKPQIWQTSMFCKMDDSRWLMFEVWAVFLNQVEKWLLKDGAYYLKIHVASDQLIRDYWFKIRLNNQKAEGIGLSLFENIRRKFENIGRT